MNSKSIVRTCVAAAAVWWGAASSTQAQSCPSNPAAATILTVRCSTDTATTGINPTPCKLSSTAELAPKARLVEITICSKVLKRAVNARVVLPPKYYRADYSPAALLYMFSGANNSASINDERSYRDWTSNTDIETVSSSTNAIIVSPENGPIGWYSDWRGTPTAIQNWLPVPWVQKWESHFFDEVIPLIEGKFRNNGQRVSAGLSMGGLGAVSYAARAPLHGKSFKAAVSFSGALSTTANYLVPQATLVNKAQDPNILWGNPTDASSDWPAHDPKRLVDSLVNIPVWVGSGNGAGNDPVEFGAWGMSTDYANAQDSAINRARSNALAVGATPPKGYVLRDMGKTVVNGVPQGCTGKHDWANWKIAIKRSWAFIKANLESSGPVAYNANFVPAACGDVP